jgi:hypothetical protein
MPGMPGITRSMPPNMQGGIPGGMPGMPRGMPGMPGGMPGGMVGRGRGMPMEERYKFYSVNLIYIFLYFIFYIFYRPFYSIDEPSKHSFFSGPISNGK